MTVDLTARPVVPAAEPPADPPPRKRRLTAWHGGLAALAIASATVYLWGLAGGARSEYYASVVLSMSKSWSNFLFGAMDPAGTVSLDKIPGSFWVPALFIKVFGFSTWSVDAPNAIATVVAVLLVAVTGRRIAGPTAGILAGLVVATTPILAAVARTNQPQAFFVLGLALVAWAATKAVQRESLQWLVIAGVCVAIAFHTYMLEAWAVWPALGIAYLCTAQPWLRKIRHVLIAGCTSLVLSLTWILIVSLTPASSRPWVGGSNGNSAWEMVFGYNGLGRFGSATASTDYRSFTPQFSGDPGVFRLFNSEVAGQIGWLLPTAVVAIVILFLVKAFRPLTVFLAVWFATMVAMFSVVAGMHQFYTSALAVPVGLLVGCTFGAARRVGHRPAQIALVVAAAVTAVGITRYSPDYLAWVVVVQVVVAVVAVLLIALGGRGLRVPSRLVAALAAAGMLLTPAAWALDVVNHPNSINPVAGDGSAANAGFGGGAGRVAGNGGTTDGRGVTGRGGAGRTGVAPGGTGGGAPDGAGGGGSLDSAVLSYVQAHRGDAEYLLATFGGQAASYYITATDGDAVLPIGGFGSADPTPTLSRFTELVSSGELRFVLVGGAGGGFGGGGSGSSGFGGMTPPAGGLPNSGTPSGAFPGNTAPGATGQGATGQGNTGRAGGAATSSTSSTSTEIRSWVQANCTAVDGVTGLYDCAG